MSKQISIEKAKEAFKLTIDQIYDRWDPAVDWNKVYENILNTLVDN